MRLIKALVVEVTFVNNGNDAVGNIHYRTSYTGETGVVHESSAVDAVIEKLVQPGEERTITLEPAYIGTEARDCVNMGLRVISCDVLANLTSVTPAVQAQRAKNAGRAIVEWWRKSTPEERKAFAMTGIAKELQEQCAGCTDSQLTMATYADDRTTVRQILNFLNANQ